MPSSSSRDAIPNYWPDDYLPDGTPLPAGMVNWNGDIFGWQGFDCPTCHGDGCVACGKTGESFGLLFRVEE